jgi:NTP pyrophosphatase (non-canonical NTP hydrolase)
MEEKQITTMKEAQALCKSFAERNGWPDEPNVDKFDHLHEELIEMSQHLRYKSAEERQKFVDENKEIFKDGIGDLFFGTCRLANQLGVDIEEAFNMVQKEILAKYNHQNPENNIVRK